MMPLHKIALTCILILSACGTPTITSMPVTMTISPTIAWQTYFVDNELGSDANSGTQAQPWKTIRKVNSEMANFKPGDLVLFKRGDTWILNASGEAGSLVISSSGVTFGAYGSGNLPLFDGTNMQDTGNTMWKGMVVFGNVSYVTIEDLDLYNAIKQQIGIGTQGARSDHITIQNCTIRTNRTNGFMLMYVENDNIPNSVTNIIIRDNQIYDSKWNAMRITGGVTNVFIYGNAIHDVIHNGIDTYPTKNNNSNFQIYDNNIYNFGIGVSGAGIYIPGTDDAEVFNNDIHDSQGTNDTYGVKSGSENGFVNKNVVVRSNQIWNINSPNSNTYALWFDSCTNCGAFNNTLYANTDTILDQNNAYLSIKNNLAYANLRDQKSMRNYDQDPQFVNAAAGDVHLQPSSPACIAGENGTYIGAYPCQ
jgi:Right handed beta helix region